MNHIFKISEQIIKETAKSVGNLYHYTTIDSLFKILNENALKTINLDSISFTRNKNFHKQIRDLNKPLEVRLLIDGDKISNKYKIIPHSDKDFVNSPDEREQEERVFKEIHNIKNYIKLIEINEGSLDYDENERNKELEIIKHLAHGIPVKITEFLA